MEQRWVLRGQRRVTVTLPLGFVGHSPSSSVWVPWHPQVPKADVPLPRLCEGRDHRASGHEICPSPGMSREKGAGATRAGQPQEPCGNREDAEKAVLGTRAGVPSQGTSGNMGSH